MVCSANDRRDTKLRISWRMNDRSSKYMGPGNKAYLITTGINFLNIREKLFSSFKQKAKQKYVPTKLKNIDTHRRTDLCLFVYIYIGAVHHYGQWCYQQIQFRGGLFLS